MARVLCRVFIILVPPDWWQLIMLHKKNIKNKNNINKRERVRWNLASVPVFWKAALVLDPSTNDACSLAHLFSGGKTFLY